MEQQNGIHLYVVEGNPDNTDGMTELTQFNHYYGVFQVDGANNTYDITYDYANHPLIVASNEPSSTLLSRADNAANAWSSTAAVLNVPLQEISLSTSGSGEFIVDSKEFEWTGAISTDWNTAGNWLPVVVPPASANITIPDVTNQPVLDMDRLINDLTLDTNATVNLNGFQLSLSGNLEHNGDLLSNGGTLNFNGTSGQQEITANLPMTVDDIIFDNADDVINTARNILVKGTLTVSQGNFNTGDSLILVSDASGTARIGEITGVGVQGEVSMERYIDTG